MNQPELFYESYLEALRDDVRVIGGAKAVGLTFHPQKEPEAARNWVNDRLSLGRRERFEDDQERYIMRKAREARGFSAALCYLCDDTGFDRPIAKNPVDVIAKRQQEFIDAVKSVQQIGKDLERLTQTPLQAVR